MPKTPATILYGTSGNDIFKNPLPDQYILSGKYELHGGAGNDVYYVTNQATIVEDVNGGQDTVVAATNYKLSANVENLILWGSSAGVGSDNDNMIQGGSAANFINGGKGNDSLFGGGGADVFQFDAQSGHDEIFDWNSSNVIRLSYSQFTSLADVKAAMTQVGNDIVLKFDANDDLTIANARISDITAANVQLPLSLTGMHLSFDDEFNGFSARLGATAKTGIWSTDFGASSGSDSLGSRTLYGNGEREIYVDPLMKGQGSTALGLNPFSIDNGVLSITAAPTPAADKAALYNYDYTSGYISTRDTFAQTYGYFEAKMKLPTGNGSWPAFWMFRKDQVWPPELDIMEAWNDSTAVQTLHTQQTGAHTQTASSTWIPDGGDTFHTYGFLWTATTLTWYLDGVAVFSQPTPTDMHSPMYMILNNAISGAVDDPNYTSSLEVDYVRAYSLGDLPVGTGVVNPDATVAATTAVSNTAASHPYWGAVNGFDDGFNVNYYLAQNPDVAKSGLDPLQHYLQYGRKEGRLPYDSSSNAGTPSAGVSLGVTGTSTITPTTSTPATVPTPTTTTPTTTTTTTTATTHAYWGQDLNQPDGFNAAYYAAHNPDVVAAGLNLLYHFEKYGKAEGRLGYDPTVTQVTTHADWGAVSSVQDGFNAAYYLAHNADVAVSGLDPLYHYEKYGKAEGRLGYEPATTTTTPTTNTPTTTTPTSTTPTTTQTTTHAYWGQNLDQPDGFNAAYYAAHNPDVVASGLDLLYHFEKYGKAEGRLAYDSTATQVTTHAYWGVVSSVQDGFNAAYYLAHNADVAVSGLDPLYHYETYGKAEGRLGYDHSVTSTATTTPTTATATTATATSSAMTVASPVADTGATTTHGYWGAAADTPYGFNAAYYLANNPDVAASGLDPLHHYQTYGKTEGRLGYETSLTTFFGRTDGQTDGFNAAYYALHNPDVVAAGVNLLSHFEANGKSEGRLAYDDGSGRETSTGTGGNDAFVAPASFDHVFTGGAGNDTFTFAPGIGWDTITDFDAAHDKLDLAALTAKYGAPTVSAISWESGSMIHYSGGETVLLLGVSVNDAQHAAFG